MASLVACVDANEVPEGYVSLDFDWSPLDDDDECGGAESVLVGRIGATLTVRIETAEELYRRG